MTRRLLPFLLIASIAPSAAFADDASYCADLSELYRRYLGQEMSRNPMPDVSASAAIAECQKGNYAAGIPVLEKKLLNARFTLPKRA